MVKLTGSNTASGGADYDRAEITAMPSLGTDGKMTLSTFGGASLTPAITLYEDRRAEFASDLQVTTKLVLRGTYGTWLLPTDANSAGSVWLEGRGKRNSNWGGIACLGTLATRYAFLFSRDGTYCGLYDDLVGSLQWHIKWQSYELNQRGGFEMVAPSTNETVAYSQDYGLDLTGILRSRTTAVAAGQDQYEILSDVYGTEERVFHVNSNGNATNYNGTYTSFLSDRRSKQNIVDAGSQWDDVKNYRVCNFNFKGTPEDKLIGVIAQEMALVSPGLVQEDEEGYLEVKYSILFNKMAACTRELQSRIEALEAELDASGM